MSLPGVRFTSATPGLDNTAPVKPGAKQVPQPENLMKKAIELAADEEISEADIKILTQIANADGDLETSEAIFLSDMETAQIFKIKNPNDRVDTFVEQLSRARLSADFNPDDFVFVSKGVLSLDGAKLPDGQDSDITLRFGNERINGGPRTTFTANQEDLGKAARDGLQQLIATPATPDNLKAAAKWNKIDKFDLDAVSKFLKGRNLSPADQAQFTQKYFQGYYDHTGVGGDWGGITDIQKQLKHVPSDAGGRKFIECEAFSAITQKLFPGTQIYTVRDSNGPEDANGARNHQVSVIRIGDQRFVQSNDTIQEITTQQLPANSAAVKELSDEDLIAAFDEKGARPLTRAIKDPTILADGSEVFDVGEAIILTDVWLNPDHSDSKLIGKAEMTVVERIDDFTMRVEGTVSKTPYILRFEPQNNRHVLVSDPPPAARPESP